jgi:hypothetical protein
LRVVEAARIGDKQVRPPNTSIPPPAQAPIYALVLRAEPDNTDPVRNLRLLLKAACVEIAEVSEKTP